MTCISSIPKTYPSRIFLDMAGKDCKDIVQLCDLGPSFWSIPNLFVLSMWTVNSSAWQEGTPRGVATVGPREELQLECSLPIPAVSTQPCHAPVAQHLAAIQAEVGQRWVRRSIFCIVWKERAAGPLQDVQLNCSKPPGLVDYPTAGAGEIAANIPPSEELHLEMSTPYSWTCKEQQEAPARRHGCIPLLSAWLSTCMLQRRRSHWIDIIRDFVTGVCPSLLLFAFGWAVLDFSSWDILVRAIYARLRFLSCHHFFPVPA